MDEHRRFDQKGLGSRLRLLLASLDGDLQQVYDAMGEPFRPRFYPVVQQLRASGSSTVGELAVRTGVSQPAMTQTLGEMRARGLVASEKGRGVRLTAEGEALCRRLEPVWHAVDAAVAELDRELLQPLGATIAAALSRLADRSFAERIQSALESR